MRSRVLTMAPVQSLPVLVTAGFLRRNYSLPPYKVEPCAGCITVSVTCQGIVDNTEFFFLLPSISFTFFFEFLCCFQSQYSS